MSSLNPYSPPNPLPEDDPPLVAQLAVEGEGMTIEFEQVFEDLIILYDLHWRKQKFMTRHFSGVLAAAMGMFGLMLVPRGTLDQENWWGASLFLLLAAVFGGLWLYTMLGRRYLFRKSIEQQYAGSKNYSILGIRRMTITPEFLIASSPIMQSAQRWIGIEKICLDSGAIIIFNSAMSAYILPRRAFNSDQHFHEFAAQAEKYLAASGGQKM